MFPQLLLLSTVCCKNKLALSCQTSLNGSSEPHAKPHKKKLWNSLELSNELEVHNVSVDHAGEYTCSASSGQMEKSASAFLKVYGRCSGNHTAYFSLASPEIQRPQCRCNVSFVVFVSLFPRQLTNCIKRLSENSKHINE